MYKISEQTLLNVFNVIKNASHPNISFGIIEQILQELQKLEKLETEKKQENENSN